MSRPKHAAVERMQARAEAPKVTRLSRATFAAGPTGTSTNPVEQDGRYNAGMIPGVSLCSKGEALGHGFWIDSIFLAQIVDAANTATKPVKSRFTHPGLCSDGMGKALGTIDNTSTDGNQAIGDLHFFNQAHNAPDGDLAGYVDGLAKEAADAFGLSIVFEHDREAEIDFAIEHGAKWAKDDDGFPYLDYAEFESPDPMNVEHLPHCRLASLKACDVVDEPAANPNGLFHRENALLADGSKLMDFLVGKTADLGRIGSLSSLGIDIAPDRLKSFVSQYLAANGLSVSTPNGGMMAEKPKDTEDEKDEKTVPTKPDEKEPVGGAPGDPGTGNTDDSAEDDTGDDNEEGDKSKKMAKDEKDDEDDSGCSKGTPDASLAEYCSAFGHEQGAKFFLAGKSFKAAQTDHIAALRAELAEKNKQLDAFAKSGIAPVGFTAAGDKERDKNNTSAASAKDEPIDNRAKFAELNKPTIEAK